MQKKIIAWILLGALLLGFVAMAVSASTPAYYQVGYSKVDINPYYDEEDHSQGLMPVPLRGNSYEEQRLALPEKMDDNGDGIVDDNDGIFATCIVVTDQYDNTVVLIATDMIGGFASLISNPVRQAIYEKYPQITGDKVMIAGSHTHHSIALTLNTSKTLDEHSKECLNIYIERMKANLVKAVDEAMADRSAARMYKGQIEANEAKAATGLVGDTLNKYRPADNQVTEVEFNEGRTYNGVRHYRVDTQDVARDVIKSDSSKTNFYYYDFLEDANGYIPDENSPKITYVGGDNFNRVTDEGSAYAKETYWVKADGVTRVDESNIEYKGGIKFGDWVISEDKPYVKGTYDRVYYVPDMKVVSNVDHVSETDDTMLITEFRFEDTAKKPVILVNWRAHTNMSRYVSDDYNTEKWDVGFYTSFFQVSSDWINAFRFVLEQEGYRVGYFIGAAGNVNPGSRVESESAWLSYATTEDRTHVKNKGGIYGSELAEVALELLRSDDMKEINTDGSAIRTQQIVYQTTKQEIDAATYLAALQYDAAYIPAKAMGVKKYTVTYWKDADGNALISKANAGLMTDPETGAAAIDPTTGETYKDVNGNPVVGVTKVTEAAYIASIQHSHSAISRYASTSGGSKIELNAIMIGDEWAAVTAPGEMFDRYSKQATLDTINQYNDWENLWGSNLGGEYGEQYVLGYCTNGNGYFPSYATYDFSKDVDGYIQGSYETQTTTFAQGTGEDVIVEFGKMLENLVENTDQGAQNYCQHCKKAVSWLPLSQYLESSVQLTTGHYYVDQEVLSTPALTARAAQPVCIDLRGNTLSGTSRAFEVNSGAVLSVMDSVGTGKVIGRGTTLGTDNGGTVTVGGTFNLYGGTLTFEETEGYSVKNGGVLYCSTGTFNMYGGTIRDGHGTWVGGNIYIYYLGQMNMYGGSVIGGKADYLADTNNAVVRGKLTLSGDAYFENPRLWPDSAKEGFIPLEEMLTIEGTYTGEAMLTLPTTAKGTDIGSAGENANLDKAKLTVKKSTYVPLIQDGQLILGNARIASSTDTQGNTAYATTLQAAISATAEGGTVQLLTDVTENVTVSQNITLELNGNSMGSVTVAQGKTLTCKDSATADFDISDGKYTKLKVVSGNVQAAPATENENPYLMIREGENIYSFHAVGLNIHSMALKPEDVGLYYCNNFAGDHMVKEKIRSYGVALSVRGIPTAETMGTTSQFTYFDGSTFGQGSATSSLLYGVMKTTNGVTSNKNNAAMKVYGRAYVQLDDGSYLFGITRVRSLQEQVELADEKYFETYKESLAGLYQTYGKSMTSWAIPNLKAYLGK